MNQKRVMVLDIVFYLIFPLVIWKFGRDMLGDYPAMIVSSVPGIIYSVYRFWEIKRINVFGVFMLVTLVAGTLVEILAGSAIQLLWNQVYYTFAIGFVFLLTIFIKRPLGLLFALDIMEMQGASRKDMKEYFYHRKIYFVFVLITLLFTFRDWILAIVKIYLIREYGVDAFTKGILYRQLFSWAVTALTVGGYVYVSIQLNKMNPVLFGIPETKKEDDDDNKLEK